MKKKLVLAFITLFVVSSVVCGVFLNRWYAQEGHGAGSTAEVNQPTASASVAGDDEALESSGNAAQETAAPKPETLTIYPQYPEQILRAQDYTVRLRQTGYTEEIAVYNRNTAVETWWGRSQQPDRYRRFCEFAFTGEPVQVQVQAHVPVQSYRVLSASGELPSKCDGQTITITLAKPETFLVEINDDYNTLLTVFAEEPETAVPAKGDEKTLVVEGYYEPEGGYLRIDEPGTTIYLAPGAVLCARLSINADNVTLRGRGAVLDPWSNLFAYDITQAPDNKLVNIAADHVTVEGVKLLDARNYNLWADFGVEDLSVTGVKVLSAAATTDGLTLLGTTGSTISDSFFYCGDNALVFEEGLAGTKILNCMVGTTCAAVFPQQDIAGDITIDGLYVFRADEGLVNNRYNNKDWDRTVESVTIRNVNASDCRNLPWFFHGRFMGTQSKNFVFENIALPQMKSVMDEKLEQPQSLIRIDNYPEDRQTGGYRMHFTNLYVGGAAVKDTSALLIKDERALNNTYTVSVTQPECPVRPAAQIAVQQQNSGEAKQQSNTAELNLLAEHNAPYASIWCEGVSYLTNLTLSSTDGAAVYRLMVEANSYENGRMLAPLNLTQEELQALGGLSLRFEASAKTPGEVKLRLSAATQEGTQVRAEKSITCGGAWSSYEVVWSKQELEELGKADLSAQGGVVLELIPQGGAYKEILLRGFDLRSNQ